MKCDFHVHTRYSYDSISLPEQIVKVALKKGIDCLAITDHCEVKGVAEVKSHAKGSILVIPGIEIKSRQGDILGLNVREVIPDGLSAKDTIGEIKRVGGMAIIAHPFAWPYAFKGSLEDLIGDMDGIEVFNSALLPSANKRAKELVKKHSLPFTAGSDAHFPESVGNAYLEIPGENLSLGQVLEAIRQRRGRVVGEEVSYFKKIVDHIKRNICKIC